MSPGWPRYSTGFNWNEVDKLKADMMNRPDRWASVTADQVRAKCRALGMRAHDVDTITDFVQRRKRDGDSTSVLRTAHSSSRDLSGVRFRGSPGTSVARG